jgi:hypothetical protein
MTWNYRILVHTHGKGGERLPEPYYAVHEVYYDDSMTPHSCTVEPVTVGGESPADIEKQLSVMLVDIERPPIDFSRIARASVGKSAEAVHDDDNLEFMQEVWGDQPSGPYDPTSAVHCAWELFGRSGSVPSNAHVEVLVETRTHLAAAMDSLASLHASRRRRSFIRRIRIAAGRLLARIGL